MSRDRRGSRRQSGACVTPEKSRWPVYDRFALDRPDAAQRQATLLQLIGIRFDTSADQAPITSRMSAASSRTRASSVSHEHMNRAPPLPIKV